MTYVAELDDLPWEAQQSVATTFRYWPRLDGRLILASSTAGHCHYTVVDENGTVVQAQTNVTPTTVDVGSRNVSRLDLSIPAIATLDENYQVRIHWQEDGGSEDHVDLRMFSVVLIPFNDPRITFNDLLEGRADAGPTLNRIGQRLGYTAGDEAREYAAALCARRAREDLYRRVRDAVTADRAAALSETRAPVAIVNSVIRRPALILNRSWLIPLERYEALKHMYLLIAKDPGAIGPETEAGDLYQVFGKLADREWESITLKYDGSETLTVDEVVKDVARATYHTKIQA